MNQIAPERVRFNPFSDEFRRDPYPLYRRLRAEDPHHRVLGMWVFTRYSDVVAVLRDRRFSSSLIPNIIRKQKPPAPPDGFDPVDAFIAKAIVFTENPDHARLRRLVNDCFAKSAVEHERARFEQLADTLLAPHLGSGEMEAMADYAEPIPLHVTCDRIGIGEADRERVKAWTFFARFLLDPGLLSKKDYLQVEGALSEFVALMRSLLEERKSRPGSDLMSRLLAARSGSDRLSDDEVVLTCIMSFVAGFETTKALIGNALLTLAEHPDQMRRLAADRTLLPQAVDEVLRFEAPLQQTKRVALEDVEIGPSCIKRGDQVLLCLGAANRDPEHFVDPDRFDVTRSGPPNVAFGYGMRACLGGVMAHVETQVALDSMLRRTEGWTVADPERTWADHSRILRSPQRLRLRFSPRAVEEARGAR